MIAPKGPGATVRREYESDFGVPALIAVHQDYSGKAWDNILTLAKALGATKPGTWRSNQSHEHPFLRFLWVSKPHMRVVSKPNL